MITINLKPGAKRDRGSSPFAAGLARLKGVGEKVKDPYRLGALALGTAWLGFVGYSYLAKSTTIADLEPKLEQARAEHQRFRAVLNEKRGLEAVRDSIRAQIATIQDVDADRYVWPHILDEVSRAVPPYTWLTDIAFQVVPPAPVVDSTAPVLPPPVRIQVTGRTVDIQGYTRLLRQLEDSPWLAEVTAISANTVVEQDRAVTAFILRARYERPRAGRTAEAAGDVATGTKPAAVAQAQEN